MHRTCVKLFVKYPSFEMTYQLSKYLVVCPFFVFYIRKISPTRIEY